MGGEGGGAMSGGQCEGMVQCSVGNWGLVTSGRGGGIVVNRIGTVISKRGAGRGQLKGRVNDMTGSGMGM